MMVKIRQMWLLCVLLLLMAGGSSAEEVSGSFRLDLNDLRPQAIRREMNRTDESFQVGIALSGGGARGFAHVGVLQALEELGVDLDVVAGTSMGGIIGGLYAAGMSPAEIRQVANDVDWSSFFSNKPRRRTQLFTRRAEIEGALLSVRFDGYYPQIPTALSTGQKLVNLLSDLTQTSGYFSGGDFANLPRRLVIVATDLVSGERILFTEGSLVEAIRATMGVPLAFTPLERDGQLLMDGGLLEPIPTRAAREMGADFIIAVNTTSDLLAADEISDPVDIANQTTTILSSEVRSKLLAMSDFVITPPLENLKATDFRDHGIAYEIGYETTMAQAEELLARLRTSRSGGGKFKIEGVDLRCHSDESHGDCTTLLDAMSASMIDVETDRSRVREQVQELFQSGRFLSLSYQLTHASGSVLGIDAVPFPKIVRAELEGTKVFDSSEILAESGAFQTPVAGVADLLRQYDSILRLYRDRGYDLARVDSAYYRSEDSTLVMSIAEGRISGISVEGAKKTRDWVVTSYFPLKAGDFYSKPRAIRGVQEIFSSGLYDNVNLRLDERDGGVWITIIVKEAKFTYARLGARYHEEFHPESFVKIGYANLFGTGHELSAYSRFSEQRKLYRLQLRADRIFRTFVTYKVQGYYANNKIGLYDGDDRIGHRTDKHWGGRVGVGQQLWRLGLFEVTGRWEQVRFTPPGAEDPIERRVVSLIGSLHYDTKDRFTFARTGSVLEASAEVASDVLGGDEVFRKFEGSLEQFSTVGHKLTFHPRVAIGLSQDGLPLYDKFYLGGTRTFFGYRTDQLVGDKYFLTNLALRIGPIFSFYLTGRYDFGEVFGRFEEVRFKDLRHAWGMELALDTPLGPFSIAYGRAEASLDNIYLNLGYDF